MSRSDDERPAEEQFPIFDPVELLEASRRMRASLPPDWHPGQITATVEVTLTHHQVIGLTWAGHRRSGRTLTDREALEQEVNRVARMAGNDAMGLVNDRFAPWLQMMSLARVLQKKWRKTPE